MTQHRRSAERQEHSVEVLRRQLQCFRDRCSARRHLLQHLQSVRVSGELSGDARRSHARRDRSVHRPQERHAAGGVLRQARRRLDGHPASSKFDLFEAFTQEHHRAGPGNKEQWEGTAIFVTVDEGGGYYDSGFIQPVDFFGTGPRIPMIAVSPFSRGGHISHVYGEHSSFVKFVERNWNLRRADASAAATTCLIRAGRRRRCRRLRAASTCRRSAICSTCSISAGTTTMIMMITVTTITVTIGTATVIDRDRDRHCR